MKYTNYSVGGGNLLSSLLISFWIISASESRTLRRSLKTPILWHILYSSSSFWTRFLRSFRLSFSLSILSSFSLRVSLQLRSFLDFFPISIIRKGSSRVEFSESCWANFLFCSYQVGIILDFWYRQKYHNGISAERKKSSYTHRILNLGILILPLGIIAML